MGLRSRGVRGLAPRALTARTWSLGSRIALPCAPSPWRVAGGCLRGEEAVCRSTKVVGVGPRGIGALTAGGNQYAWISAVSHDFVLLTHVSFVDPEQSTVLRQMSFVPSQVFELVLVPPELDERP